LENVKIQFVNVIFRFMEIFVNFQRLQILVIPLLFI